MSWVPEKMVKRPGFTLLEVTIAVALIALILVTSIIAFAGTVDSSFKMREYSQKAFLNQKAMEEEITRIKQEGSPQTLTVSLFNKEVQAFPVSQEMEGTDKKLMSLVVLDRAPEPLLPEVVKVINRGKEYVYLDELAGPMDYQITGPTNDLSLWYTQWFIADPYLMDEGLQRDFSMPLEFVYGDGATTSEDLYPTYPNHFTGTRILGSQMALTEEDLGRHLVYHVQPVGHYGITGKANQSALIYAMGVPVVNGLRHHIDINFFAKPNGENLLLGEENAVTDLTSISDMRNRTAGNKPTSISLMNVSGQSRIKSVTKYRMLMDGGRLERIQKRLRLKHYYFPLSDSANRMTLSMNIFYQGQDATLFEQYGSGNQQSSLRWDLKIMGHKVTMRLPQSSGGQTQVVYVSDDLTQGEMHTITFKVASGERGFQLLVDGVQAELKVNTSYTPAFTTGVKRIGGTGDLELTELVYYNRVLTASEFDQVDTYMRDKYRHSG